MQTKNNKKMCFNVFEQLLKQKRSSWEVVTFAKSSVHFTACSEEPRRGWGTFPAMDKVPYHIGVGTLYAKGGFKEKQRETKIALEINNPSLENKTKL